jgi:tRNA(Arg) A34 adenosine deaminase TadA
MWEELSDVWRTCLDMAWRAYCADSVAVGAAVTDSNGTIISVGSGHLLSGGETSVFRPAEDDKPLEQHPLAHAELQALLALYDTGVDPTRCILYTTLEPCPLCVGATCMANVRELHYACRDPWAGSAELVQNSRYLGSNITTLVGPEHEDLEVILAAVAVEQIMREMGPEAMRRHDDAWPRIIPLGVQLGEILFETGRLQRMRQAQMCTREMVCGVSALARTAAPVGA